MSEHRCSYWSSWAWSSSTFSSRMSLSWSIVASSCANTPTCPSLRPGKPESRWRSSCERSSATFRVACAAVACSEARRCSTSCNLSGMDLAWSATTPSCAASLPWSWSSSDCRSSFSSADLANAAATLFWCSATRDSTASLRAASTSWSPRTSDRSPSKSPWSCLLMACSRAATSSAAACACLASCSRCSCRSRSRRRISCRAPSTSAARAAVSAASTRRFCFTSLSWVSRLSRWPLVFCSPCSMPSTRL
mmetsp:Transcript_27203/g.60184  ORF Transcript_27203/g.60184 Transcript_27203/m.60184 type:complete len:250 (+) Transcript_27203:605-1354(+)